MYVISRLNLAFIFVAAAVVYLIGMIFPVLMDVDATQYASMSMEMLETGNFLQLKNRYLDYLDKPPLLFWLSSLSMKLFGLNHFAYRLPSVLSTILGAYSAYRLGGLLYNKNVGRIASILWVTNQAFFLINHDIRTDTLLTNFVAFASWQMYAYTQHNKPLHLLGAFVGIGLAMLSKGPIGIVAPILAFGPHWLYKREWNNIFKWQWLVGFVIIAIILAPMTYGLYEQYGMRGVRFYYWTQSFGRITGESEWKNDSDPFFFWHTFLWSFLPWMFIASYAFVKKIIRLVTGRLKRDAEILTLSGFLLVMLAMSSSNFKLPHYIYVAWIYIVILTAEEIDHTLSYINKKFNWYVGFQTFVSILLWLLGAWFVFYVFPLKNAFIWVGLIAALAGAIFFTFGAKSPFEKLILPSLLSIIGINLLLNAHIYPSLGKYQAGSESAVYFKENNIPLDNVHQFLSTKHSTEFYNNRILPKIEDVAELKQTLQAQNAWILVNEKNKEIIDKEGITYSVKHIFEEFHITTLHIKFLRPETRKSSLENYFLLEVPRQ